MMSTLLLGCLLGITQGFRHAFEPDHLAAVSTMVVEQRSRRASVLFAATWGVGHSLVLTIVGGILFAFRREMPARLADSFELVVGTMLVLLGALAIRKAARDGRSGASMFHSHHRLAHRHEGDPDHMHVFRWTLARRPLVVGIVHGLAGSGALATLVMAKLSSVLHGVLFMVLYGAGATLGMTTLAAIVAGPLARLSRWQRALPVLLGITGLFSIGLGVVWAFAAAHRVLGG
jgi:hypothetical protein